MGGWQWARAIFAVDLALGQPRRKRRQDEHAYRPRLATVTADTPPGVRSAATPEAGVEVAAPAHTTAVGWLDRPVSGRWLALGLGVIAAAVCSWGIATPWPWNDEGATYLALQRDWAGLAVLWRGPDAPMVPYYYLAKTWTTLWSFWPGLTTLVAVRLLSAAAATATVVVLYALVARNAGRFAGVLAGLVLLSLAGFDRSAQEARGYALLALAATVSWLMSDRRLRPGRVALGFGSLAPPQGGRGSKRHDGFGPAAPHLVSLATTGTIHTFGVFQWPAHLIAWLATPGAPRIRWQRTVSIGIALGIATLVAGPQLAMVMRHGTGPQGQGAQQRVTVASVADELLRGIGATPSPSVSVLVLVLALVGLFSRPGGRRELPVGLLIWLAVPLAVEIAVGVVRTNLFRQRYWIAFLPPLAALAALGMVAIAGIVIRSLRRGQSPDPAFRSLGARVVAAATTLVLLAVQVALVLPAQSHIRTPRGHGQNLAGVFAAISDARAEYSGVRVVMSNGSANGMIGSVDPALMAANPLSRIDSSARTVYSRWPSPSSVREALAGQRYLLWIYKGRVTVQDIAQRMPAPLAELDPVVLRATPAGSGWTAVLVELPG